MMQESAIQQLKSAVRGQTLCPGDPGYDEARKIPNAMIDRRPAIIARCAPATRGLPKSPWTDLGAQIVVLINSTSTPGNAAISSAW